MDSLCVRNVDFSLSFLFVFFFRCSFTLTVQFFLLVPCLLVGISIFFDLCTCFVVAVAVAVVVCCMTIHVVIWRCCKFFLHTCTSGMTTEKHFSLLYWGRSHLHKWKTVNNFTIFLFRCRRSTAVTVTACCCHLYYAHHLCFVYLT